MYLLIREKAKEEMVKVKSPIGEHLVTNSGNLVVAHKDTTVQSIIQGDSQADVQSVARHATTSQCTRPVKPKAKNAEWDETTWQQDEVEWKESHLRDRKAKARGLSPRVNLNARVHRDRIHPGHHSLSPLEETDPNPKPNPKHALA